MTKNEIIEKIETIENYAFYLNMKDRWTFEDHRKMNRYNREIRELKEELARMEAA